MASTAITHHTRSSEKPPTQDGIYRKAGEGI
jgi:hypothetical protein